MEDIKTIIDEKKFSEIKVNDKVIQVGKLKTAARLELVYFLGQIFRKYNTKMTSLQSGETNKQDMLSLFEILEPNDMLKLLSIFSGLSETECGELDFEVNEEIIEAICKYNNFEDILKKVMGAIGKLITKITNTNS